MTFVYHIKDGDAPEGARYCGRGRGSRWGNPFRLRRGASDCERREAIARFIEYVDAALAAGELELGDLAGAAALLCWCAGIGAPLPPAREPSVCHAQYIAWLLDNETRRQSNADIRGD